MFAKRTSGATLTYEHHETPSPIRQVAWIIGDRIAAGGLFGSAPTGDHHAIETDYCIGVTDTAARVEVDGVASAIVGPDVVRCHNPGDALSVRSIAPDVAGRWLVLSPALVDDATREVCGGDRRAFDAAFLRPPLATLIALRRLFRRAAQNEGDAFWLEEKACAAIAALLGGAEPSRSQRPRGGDTARRLVRDADQALIDRFAGELRLADLARDLGVSASYLARIYKQATGSTLHQRLERLRLAEASRRLVDGEPDIAALAFDLGFSSHSHFAAVFRRSVGVAPSQVRDRGDNDSAALRRSEIR